MEKKFILTLHIAESDLPHLALYFKVLANGYEKAGDTLNKLRAETNAHLLISNMDMSQKDQFESSLQLQINTQGGSDEKI